MMIGSCDVKGDLVITHRTTYVLSKDTRPNVQRLFFVPSIVLTSGMLMAAIGFADVLYVHELILIAVMSAACLFGGYQGARLVILDKVTRGREQETANYGLHSTLQAKRSEINVEIERIKRSTASSEMEDAS